MEVDVVVRRRRLAQLREHRLEVGEVQPDPALRRAEPRVVADRVGGRAVGLHVVCRASVLLGDGDDARGLAVRGLAAAIAGDALGVDVGVHGPRVDLEVEVRGVVARGDEPPLLRGLVFARVVVHLGRSHQLLGSGEAGGVELGLLAAAHRVLGRGVTRSVRRRALAVLLEGGAVQRERLLDARRRRAVGEGGLGVLGHGVSQRRERGEGPRLVDRVVALLGALHAEATHVGGQARLLPRQLPVLLR